MAAAATAGLVVIAVNYSLRTLLEGLRYDTPLADLGLVPLISAGLALWCSRGEDGELAIRDQSVDFLVALPSLLVSSTILLALPGPTSSMFWALRLDLLAVPLLAIGTVALVWGTQMVWRQRRALLFLVAAWPIPYTHILGGIFTRLQTTTTSTVGTLLERLPIAGRVTVLPGSVIEIGRGAGAFRVAVATPCSGAEGVLGFLLVAGAGALVLKGRRSAKLAWLAAGASLGFLANIVRLVTVLVAAAHLGEHVALDFLHPWVGAAEIGAVAIVASSFAPRFGLHLPRRPLKGFPAPKPRVGWLVVLAPLVVVLAVVDSHLSVFRPVVGDLGQARLASLATDPPTVAGWQRTSSGRVTWAARFFGGGSTWDRQIYVVTAQGLKPSVVTVDAVSTADPGRFAAYDVADCFQFHGDHVLRHAHPTLGHGVTGEEFVYREHGAARAWVSLTWIWPVVAPSVRYERISLVTSLGDPTAASIASVEGSLSGFARAVAAERIAQADNVIRTPAGGSA